MRKMGVQEPLLSPKEDYLQLQLQIPLLVTLLVSRKPRHPQPNARAPSRASTRMLSATPDMSRDTVDEPRV